MNKPELFITPEVLFLCLLCLAVLPPGHVATATDGKKAIFSLANQIIISNFATVMSTIIFPSPIFGPVKSRRLGVSLGVNLLPGDGKLCNFDCIYCECGFNDQHHTNTALPTRQEVRQGLERQLRLMADKGELPDVITFAGNGEPTGHPHFPEIVADTIELRNSYCPLAKVSVLSNATLIDRTKVREALMLVDNNIQKLDTIDPTYIRLVNRPRGHLDVRETIARLKAFKGHVIIQTMFMRGTFNSQSVDNTSDLFVQPWLKAIAEIAPQSVMVYTIDRETPASTLLKATREQLDSICQRVEDIGIACSASY